MDERAVVERRVAIEMRDGLRLSAVVRMLEGVETAPAVVSYYPYLKDGFLGVRYRTYLDYLARCGFAAVFADFRGTGGSEGVKPDAFDAQESADVHDLVEGVAAEPWCDGNVGVWGLSYGGVTALRAGAARPPHLKAIVAIEGSTDPYLYEVMRFGAPGLAMIVAEWSTWMLALTATPPIVKDDWADPRAIAGQRLDALTPWHHTWLSHPHRDDYWAGREVDPADIEVPAFVITSWRDPNPHGALDDFSAVHKAPRRLLVGPWQHGIPDGDATSPIHAMREIADWFRRWLMDEANAGAARPEVSLYVLGDDAWESHAQWPPPSRELALHLTADTALSSDGVPAEEASVAVVFDATTGIHSGFGLAALAGSQTGDDERSTCFTTAPLADGLELVGTPVLDLALRAATADTDVAVRLTDVAPDSESTFITKGFVRLSNPAPHHGKPADLSGPIRVELLPTRYHVLPGHRLRLAIAASDFPEVWPQAAASDFYVVVGGAAGSRLTVRELADAPGPDPGYAPPDPALIPSLEGTTLLPGSVERDAETGRATVSAGSESVFEATDGSPVRFRHQHRMTTVPRAPERTQLTTETSYTVTQPHRELEVHARSYQSHDLATAHVRVLIDDKEVVSKHFRA